MRTILVTLVTVVLMLGGSGGYAAEQLVSTKTLVVKNPPSGARKVLWKVKETASASTIVGDPTADGATLRVQLTNGGDQCVTMPSSGWSAISTLGYKYKDATLTNGPVKVAMVKKTPSGAFLVKALLKNGGPTSIAVAPGDPTTTYATNFTLGVGDQYCGGTATATPNPNDAVTFKVSNDGAPLACVASCNATTSSTSSTSSSTALSTSSTATSTTTSTTLACGGSGQPCCGGTTCTAGGCCVSNLCYAEGEVCGGTSAGCPPTTFKDLCCSSGSCSTVCSVCS